MLVVLWTLLGVLNFPDVSPVAATEHPKNPEDMKIARLNSFLVLDLGGAGCGWMGQDRD